MKVNHKNIILPILGIAFAGVLGATVIGVAGVSAHTGSSLGSDGQTIVSRIAQRFGVKEADVQQVFDEHRDAHRADMHAKRDERLAQLVKDGKLTEAQKSAIIAKMDELEKQREADRTKFQNMTREERRSAMETKYAELETWAKAQGIDPSLFPFFGPMGSKGDHMDKGGQMNGRGQGFEDRGMMN